VLRCPGARAYGTGVRAAAIVAVVLLAAALAPPLARAAPDAVEQRRSAIAKELVRLGAELQRQIVAKDVDALLARIPPEGLRCAGTVVPRAKVARDLRAPDRWLHGTFFGAPGAPQRPGAPPSLAAFLRSAREIAIVVFFQPDPRAGPAGRPCLDFRTKDLPTPGAPLCFEQRGGRWWFTESLYPCG
jgi:hypothetical protein